MSESESFYHTMPNQKQFLRFAEVTVKNFKKQEKLVIGNEFEIEFEYFKTLDQTKEDDSGTIKIYGLTPETISLLEEEGGEVWLRCGYESSQTDILVIAYISKVYSENRNNTSVTTIECSANLLTHFYSGSATPEDDTAVPLYILLSNFSKSLGYPYMDFSIENIPKEHVPKIVEFIDTYKTNYYSVGDLRTVLEQVCEHFGLVSHRALVNEEEDTLVFSFSELGLKKALALIDKGYPKLDTRSEFAQQNLNMFAETLKVTGSGVEDSTLGFLLTKDSGLVSAQNEYQLISAFQNQTLNANERETAESVYKRNNPEEPKRSSANVEQPTTRTEQNSTPSGGDSENPYVSNNTLRGLRIKPDLVSGTNIRESTGGGDVRLHTAALAFKVQELVGSELIRFTAFNDVYHQNNSPNSLHRQGKSFDFTITTGKRGAPAVRNAVEAMAKREGFRVNVDDEYNSPSAKATAGHIHVDVYGKNGSSSLPSNPPSNSGSGNTVEESPQQGDPYGRIPIEIIRRYNRITALLNPFVKPQSIIYTEEKGTNYLLAHRVRHASYSGNNKRGDWLMVLYCEDSRTKKILDRNVETTPTSRDLSSENT